MYYQHAEDTIAAPATPQGMGAIAVIRVSGPQALSIVNRLFPAKDLTQVPSHTLHVGKLIWKSQWLDEVVVSVFKAPRSYTGEDVIEISSHGSPLIVQRILQALTEAGARMALPGEFTLRAYLHGKMDLTQAEAVADLIAAESEAAVQNALRHIRGGFSAELQQLRNQLLQFAALIELELDFSEEDVEFADRHALKQLLDHIDEHVQKLLQSYAWGNVVKHGFQVVIAGKPNVGKSTLLNALLNENRAIVSDIPGTTRDTVEEFIQLNGLLFRLIDTAGLRVSEDVIEQIGVARTHEKILQADMILYLFDVTQIEASEWEQAFAWLQGLKKPYLILINKIDLQSELPEFVHNTPQTMMISAQKQVHLNELKEKLVEIAQQGRTHGEGSIITNARHYAALQKVKQGIQDVYAGLEKNISNDLLANDIRKCLHDLGEITGEVTTEDMLDYIFSHFCIGK
ncbi:tRNA uridine-5-carboxymethylaminomethyl(34) synthesis GTPase MnmE [Thermoflavifilum thermophilum]|uniref:tRNA modification GTPase MnmE n=1 Tax=Thermoflavifilum thermophilum TaxID=1393122 RepID=A0A1I7NF79_9BACT|nr:tRNA uridine-5-carboxymethylaminomethyl(34) synthesis GTPase MnmE [Thermoflavifilum thermophilum]SFV33324.1 tRNA modification GTPase [Thermoflavifilum thermophilum]